MGIIDKKLREHIIERDDGLCRVCGRQANDIHHIMFKSHVGADNEKNLIALCRECHEWAHNYETHARGQLIASQERLYKESISTEELKR